MRIIQCAICKTNKNTSVLFPETMDFKTIDADIFSARRIPDQVHYQLLQCHRCGLIFSSPILSENALKKLYRESKLTYDNEIDSLKITYGNYLKKTLKYAHKNPKLLEVGGGNGFFLEQAKDVGVEDVSGVEPSQHAVDQARSDIKKKMVVDFFPSKKIKPASKDIICVFQTLDHITDPNSFLKACHKTLKKDGLVLTILHDTQGLSVKLLKEKSPIFDIEHIFLFNRQTLKKIFEQNGFQAVEVFAVQNTFPIRYWIRMFPLPLQVKQLLISLLKMIGLDGFLITLGAGNIGIIAKKQ